jgi:hypothetical protein
MVSVFLYSDIFSCNGTGRNWHQYTNANSALDISAANNKGLLIPRGDAATRTALNANTAKGLMMYDTVTNSLWIHSGNGLATGWNNQQSIVSRTMIPYAPGSNFTLTTIAGGSPSTMTALGMAVTLPAPIQQTLRPEMVLLFLCQETVRSLPLQRIFTFTSATNLLSPLAITFQVFISSPPG